MRRIHLLEIAIIAALALASFIAARIVSSTHLTGLNGRYWTNTTWSGEPAVTAAGDLPAAIDFVQRRSAAQRDPGSAEWSGWLIVDRPGEHVFDVVADDGAWLFVDDKL